MKRLVAVFLLLSLFVFVASQLEAAEEKRSGIQAASDFIAEIEKIGEISDSKAQVRAIAEFMRKVQGFGDPAKVEEAKNLLNKYAFSMGDGKWAVIYESKNGANASSGGYIMTGENPPKDAEILPTKTIKGVKK